MSAQSEMSAAPATIGVVLAGGTARRMGGGDKSMKDVGNRRMIDHVIARLQPQCSELILNANGDPGRFSFTSLPVIPDAMPESAGPLAGIAAALDWVAENRPETEWLVTSAADTPFLPQDFVRRLHAARQEAGTVLCCARSGARTHPVNALWAVSLRDDLRTALRIDKVRRVGAWMDRHHVALACWPSEPLDPFFNVNTPEDLAQAEALMARRLEI